MPVLNRIWAMPSSDTFDIPPIGEFVKRYLAGVSNPGPTDVNCEKRTIGPLTSIASKPGNF
jgi:hypothetical protein